MCAGNAAHVVEVSRSRLGDHEWNESFLFEMLVCRQHGREPVFPHHDHGEAVRETIALVGSGLVKSEAFGKGPSGLRKHSNQRIF